MKHIDLQFFKYTSLSWLIPFFFLLNISSSIQFTTNINVLGEFLQFICWSDVHRSCVLVKNWHKTINKIDDFINIDVIMVDA